MTNPTLFVTALSIEGAAFSGARTGPAVPFIPLVVLERLDEPDGGDLVSLFFFSVQGGRVACVASVKTLSLDEWEFREAELGGIGVLDRDSPCQEGTGDGQVVPDVRGFDILERFGDGNLYFVGRCGGGTKGVRGVGGEWIGATGRQIGLG